MARRRARRSWQGWERARVPAVSCIGGAVSWGYFGEPAHLTGLILAMGLLFLMLPFLMLVAVFGAPYAIQSVVPREWRASWRGRKPREQQKSQYISKLLVRVVHYIDGYTCVYCGSDVNLNIDHMIPWRMGGLTALWNLMLLCGECNRLKSAYFVRRNGTEYYPKFLNQQNKAAARRILQVERRRRWNPLRWWLAARSMGWI